MEDSSVAIAGLLDDVADFLSNTHLEIQAPGVHPKFNDFGHLYKYGDEYEEFSPWFDEAEKRQEDKTRPHNLQFHAGHKLQKQDAEPEVLSAFANLHMDVDDSDSQISSTVVELVKASSSSQVKVCTYCRKSGNLSTCAKCNDVFYRSMDHQAADYPSHKAYCWETESQAAVENERYNPQGPSFKNFQSSEPLDKGSLQSEMFELLDMFQALQGNISDTEKRSLLTKCIHVCEQIIKQGIPHAPPPQVVIMLDEAKAVLQMIGKGGDSAGNSASTQSVSEHLPVGMSFKDMLQADVKKALDKVDSEEQEKISISEVPDEDEEFEGVHIEKGIWYCRTHKLELCSECRADHRLFNQVRRTGTEGVDVDVDVLVREQKRLQELECQFAVPLYPDSRENHDVVQLPDNQDFQDYESIAKELKEELARAREKDEADFLKYFSSFTLSEDRKPIS